MEVAGVISAKTIMMAIEQQRIWMIVKALIAHWACLTRLRATTIASVLSLLVAVFAEQRN